MEEKKVIELKKGERAEIEAARVPLGAPRAWNVRVFDENDKDLGIANKNPISTKDSIEIKAGASNVIQVPEAPGRADPILSVSSADSSYPVVTGGGYTLKQGSVRMPVNIDDLSNSSAPKINDGKDGRQAGSLSFSHIDPESADGSSRIITIEKNGAGKTEILLFDRKEKDKTLLTLSASEAERSIADYKKLTPEKRSMGKAIDAVTPLGSLPADVLAEATNAGKSLAPFMGRDVMNYSGSGQGEKIARITESTLSDLAQQGRA